MMTILLCAKFQKWLLKIYTYCPEKIEKDIHFPFATLSILFPNWKSSWQALSFMQVGMIA